MRAGLGSCCSTGGVGRAAPPHAQQHSKAAPAPCHCSLPHLHDSLGFRYGLLGHCTACKQRVPQRRSTGPQHTRCNCLLPAAGVLPGMAGQRCIASTQQRATKRALLLRPRAPMQASEPAAEKPAETRKPPMDSPDSSYAASLVRRIQPAVSTSSMSCPSHCNQQDLQAVQCVASLA